MKQQPSTSNLTSPKEENFATPTPAPASLANTWAARCFRALDCEGRGYIYKMELLDHINYGGV